MNFGPKNRAEAIIFAVEELRASVQYDILRQLKSAGLSQAQLAARMGVSAGWVSQVLSDDANLTFETVAKIYNALGRSCAFASEPNMDDRRLSTEHRMDAAAMWQVETEKVVKTEFSERRAGTTELLMNVIATRSVRIRATQNCNDNWSEQVYFKSEAV